MSLKIGANIRQAALIFSFSVKVTDTEIATVKNYILEHPRVTFGEVGKNVGLSERQVSAYCLMDRK